VPDRRAEFVFGTAAEVMLMMRDLPSKVEIMRSGTTSEAAPATAGQDEMAAALQAGKNQPPGPAS